MPPIYWFRCVIRAAFQKGWHFFRHLVPLDGIVIIVFFYAVIYCFMYQFTLDELLNGLDCLGPERELLMPLFRRERLPRGLIMSIRQGLWQDLGLIASGHLRGCFRHAFEDYTLGIFGPGHALPPLTFTGVVPSDVFIESVGRVELFVLDIRGAARLGPEHCDAAMQLLANAYDSLFRELIFWASLVHLPRAESRFAEVERHGGHLFGSVGDGVLASASRMSRRHFVRIKNIGRR